MTVYYSDQIQARKNKLKLHPIEASGRVRSYIGTMKTPASLAVGDAICLARIPAESKVRSIIPLNDDLDAGSSLAASIGLYRPMPAGDSVPVVVDCYASAQTLFENANKTQLVELAFQNRSLANANNFAFQDAGNATLPSSSDAGSQLYGNEYDLTATITATDATLTSGQILFLIEIVVD